MKTSDIPGTPAGLGLSYDADDREIAQSCYAEVGEAKIRGLTPPELRSRYDSRVVQFACLVERGLVAGEAPSFETFSDEYERSGQQVLWEPTADARNGTDDQGRTVGPSQLCPRTEW